MRTLMLILLFIPSLALADTSLTPTQYKTLNSIQELLSSQEYSEAQAKLDKFEQDLKPGFGLALAYQLHGQLWLMQEQPEKGLKYFQQALELNVLAPAQEAGIATTTAQILMSLDRADDAYAELEPRLQRILEQEQQDEQKSPSRRGKGKHGQKPEKPRYIQAQSFATLATACQMRKHYKSSIPWLKHALARSESPKENWYLMLMVAFYQEQQYAATIEVLDELIRLNPSKEDYWQQQAALYQLIEQPAKSLRTLELGYAGGYIHKSQSIMQLVQLLLNQGLPERAGRVLQQALDTQQLELNERNWKLLASAWQQGRERHKAAQALVAASEFMQDGALIYRAAQLNVQDGNYVDSIRHAQMAVKKGLNEKSKANALLLIASSAYELNDFGLSRRYFQQALQFANTAPSAKNWLDYLSALEDSQKLAAN